MAPESGKFTVTFDANGGSVSETSRQTVEGVELGALPTAQRLGYDFVGWFVADEGEQRKVTSSDIVVGDVTVTAHWTLISYPITYGLGDGATNNSNNPLDYTIEDEIVLQAPERPGYEFLGWTPDGGVITNGSVGAKIFTAQWKSASGEDSKDPDEQKQTYCVGMTCSINLKFQRVQALRVADSVLFYAGVRVFSVSEAVPLTGHAANSRQASWLRAA